MKGCFFRCKNSLGQPHSHVLFYSNDDLFGSVSCRFSLISKYNIPFAKAVLLKEVIVYLLMVLLLMNYQKISIFFARAAGKTNS